MSLFKSSIGRFKNDVLAKYKYLDIDEEASASLLSNCTIMLLVPNLGTSGSE